MFNGLTRARRRAVLCLALVVSGLAGVAGLAHAQGAASDVHTVEVFVNSAMAVTAPQAPPYRVTIHRMDQLDMATQAIDQLIPRGGEEVARRWVAANEARIKRQVQPAAIATANAIGLANHYRLDRMPAVVVNRRTVVYGVLDVSTALQHYQTSRRGRP